MPVWPPVISVRLSGLLISPLAYGNGPSVSVGVTVQLPDVLVVVVVVEVDAFVEASFPQASNNIGPAAAATAKVLKKFLRSIFFIIRSTFVNHIINVRIVFSR